MKTVMNR